MQKINLIMEWINKKVKNVPIAEAIAWLVIVAITAPICVASAFVFFRADDFAEGIVAGKTFSVISYYDNSKTISGISTNFEVFKNWLVSIFDIEDQGNDLTAGKINFQVGNIPESSAVRKTDDLLAAQLRITLTSHSRIHTSPLVPSLIMRESVSDSLILASSGMFCNLPLSPSLTSSYRVVPNILVSQIFAGSFSNSRIR